MNQPVYVASGDTNDKHRNYCGKSHARKVRIESQGDATSPRPGRTALTSAGHQINWVKCLKITEGDKVSSSPASPFPRTHRQPIFQIEALARRPRDPP
jgi:hypothetical protein